jgi:hypothetical protein
MRFVLLLLAALSIAKFANAQTTWSSGLLAKNEGVYAGTVNDSGAVFGRYCYFADDSCYWVLSNSLSCEETSTYPALAAAKDAANIELVCAGKPRNSNLHKYFLKPYDTIEALVGDSGGVLGVATVAEGGNFRVFRFDLSGAKRAMQDADILYRQKVKTKDQTL